VAEEAAPPAAVAAAVVAVVLPSLLVAVAAEQAAAALAAMDTGKAAVEAGAHQLGGAGGALGEWRRRAEREAGV
jgi:hypothetical protein